MFEKQIPSILQNVTVKSISEITSFSYEIQFWMTTTLTQKNAAMLWEKRKKQFIWENMSVNIYFFGSDSQQKLCYDT